MIDLRNLSDEELERVEQEGSYAESLAAEQEQERRYAERESRRARHAFAVQRGQHNARLHRGGF